MLKTVFLPQDSGQFFSVKLFGFTLEAGIEGGPYHPRRVCNLILDAAAIALARVSPIVFSNELLLRTRFGKHKVALHREADSVPPFFPAFQA